MGAVKFFDAMEFLEPKCPICQQVLEYGVNTTYKEGKHAHVCNCCGEVLK